MSFNANIQTTVRATPSVELEKVKQKLSGEIVEFLQRKDASRALEVMLKLLGIEHKEAQRFSRLENEDNVIPSLKKNAKNRADCAGSMKGTVVTVLGHAVNLAILYFAIHKGLPADMSLLKNRLDIASNVGSTCKEIGGTLGHWMNSRNQAETYIYENEKSNLELLSQRLREHDSTESRKVSEMIEKIMRLAEQLHSAKTRMMSASAA